MSLTKNKINKSYTTEYIEKYVNECMQNNEEKESVLTRMYIDRIRNGRKIHEEMLLEIENFSTENKMKIIREFNLCINIYHDLFTDK